MAQRIHMQLDDTNMNYNELLKRREDKQKNTKDIKTNPFVKPIVQKKADQKEVYSNLFRLSKEEQILTAAVPNSRSTENRQQSKQISSNPQQIQQKTKNLSDFKQCLNTKQDSTKQQSNILGQLFMNSQVSAELAKINTGEQAISYFAKYGSTTPIKLLNCVRSDYLERNNSFRPYDLTVVHSETLPAEHFVVSPNGIIHICEATKESTANLEGISESSTEVIPIADWVHELTLFNIITKIPFFKNFAAQKLFKIWKAKASFQQFCDTRKKLMSNVLIAKPAFAKHLLAINEQLFDVAQIKTISNAISMNKILTQEEFKVEQNKTLLHAAHLCEGIIDKVKATIETVGREVDQRTKFIGFLDAPNGDDIIGGLPQMKSKPRYEIALEMKEKANYLEKALQDQGKIKKFVTLVEYLIQEKLIEATELSMNKLAKEISKDRKQGLVATEVTFEEDKVKLNPSQIELTDIFLSIMLEMANINISNSNLRKAYFKQQPQEKSNSLGNIIINSHSYATTKQLIVQKLADDFLKAQQFIDSRYQKFNYLLDSSKNRSWNFETSETNSVELGEMTFKLSNPLRETIAQLIELQLNITKDLKDSTQGVIHVQGQKIKYKLEIYVIEQMNIAGDRLIKSINRLSQDLLDKLSRNIAELTKHPKNLKEYTNYMKIFQEIKEQFNERDNLESLLAKKIEIEEMRVDLKKINGQQCNQNVSGYLKSDQDQFEEIEDQFDTLADLLIRSEEVINSFQTKHANEL